MTLWQPWEINFCSPSSQVDQEPTEDILYLSMLLGVLWLLRVFCLPLFTCSFILLFKILDTLYLNSVFQIVLDSVIGQTIHFAYMPKFLHIFKVKLMGRQFEYNRGCTKIYFSGKWSPLRAKEWLGQLSLRKATCCPFRWAIKHAISLPLQCC